MNNFREISVFNVNRLYLFMSPYRLSRMLKASINLPKENRWQTTRWRCWERPTTLETAFSLRWQTSRGCTGKVSTLQQGPEWSALTFHFPDVFHRIRQNINRTKVEAMCRWPHKKVLTMPQQPSKTYLPHRYVIYRCSDDTACCGSSDKTCVAKKTEEVVLWFHVASL